MSSGVIELDLPCPRHAATAPGAISPSKSHMSHGWLETLPSLCPPLVIRGDLSAFLYEETTYG